MIFSGIKGITIPEGVVQQIADGAGSILWKGGVDVAAMAISYTGAYTDQLDVVMSGKTYRLLILTGSGTLTIPEEVTADVWMCSGGNGGAGYGSFGGGGGFIQQTNGASVEKTTVCVVGAGAVGAAENNANGIIGNHSTFGSLISPEQTTTANNGASGGGAGGNIGASGKGTGESTIPFGESGLFDQHSAGGGGGGHYDNENSARYKSKGGNGGSNGSNGKSNTTGGSQTDGGSGGVKGGGAGGQGSTAGSGVDATFYGSGGGGGGCYITKSGNVRRAGGGAGYQGVVYVRIPYEQ